MRVTHGHVDGRVSHEILHGLQIGPFCIEVCREGVSQRMPARVRDAGNLAELREVLVGVRVLQTSALVREDARVDLRQGSKGCDHIGGQWERAEAIVLRRVHVSRHFATDHLQGPGFEVHGTPLQGDELVETQARAKRHEHEFAPRSGRTGREQLARILFSDELRLRWRCPEELHPRKPLELLPLDGRGKAGSQQREAIVDGLRLEAARELVTRECTDVCGTDRIESHLPKRGEQVAPERQPFLPALRGPVVNIDIVCEPALDEVFEEWGTNFLFRPQRGKRIFYGAVLGNELPKLGLVGLRAAFGVEGAQPSHAVIAPAEVHVPGPLDLSYGHSAGSRGSVRFASTQATTSARRNRSFRSTR